MGRQRGQDEEQADPPAGGEDGARKPGGRTIGRWKVLARQELPEGTDEQVAAAVNRMAKEEGFAYSCDAALAAKWREADAKQPPALPTPEEEGYGIVVLRQLVHLLGKEGTKRLIDAL